MPEICEQIREEKLSYVALNNNYLRACKGAIEPFRIEISSKIQDELINRIFDEKTIIQIAAFYKLTKEGYLKALKTNVIPIKFMNAEIFVNKLFADNEILIFSWKNVHVVFDNLT